MATRRSAGEAFDVQRSLAEFAGLNRRRLFGSPPLEVGELERWLELRQQLEFHFAGTDAAGWNGLERREFLRLPTHLRVEVGHGSDVQIATLRDISQGGLFLATQRPLDLGSRLCLSVSLGAGAPTVELTGRVAWVRLQRSGAQPPGMGMEFDVLGPEQREGVRRLVERASSDAGHDENEPA